MGDVQVANAKTSKHLQILALWPGGWQLHVLFCTYIVAVQKIH